MGVKDEIETLGVQSLNMNAENRDPTGLWVGDELLQLLEEVRPSRSTTPKGCDRTPPADRPIFRTLAIRLPLR
jgi:hypothetical protein